MTPATRAICYTPPAVMSAAHLSMDIVVMPRNRAPPMMRTFLSSHPSRCSQPPPSMASMVHST